MIDFDNLVLASCMNTFGELVDFQPQSGPQQLGLIGVWNENFADVKFEDGNEVSTTKPLLGIRASAFLLQQPVQGDVFTIRLRRWRVQDVNADGIGHLDLTLMLATDAEAAITPGPPIAPAPLL